MIVGMKQDLMSRHIITVTHDTFIVQYPHRHTHYQTQKEGDLIREKEMGQWHGERGWLRGRAVDSQLKGLGFKSHQEQQENILLCWLLFRYPFHPCVATVACKRSWLFCQKCKRPVTAKHTCTPHVWLWMKWHSKLMHGCMMSTELALRWQQFHVAPAI